VFIVATLCPVAHCEIIYVDRDATGTKDGTTWADACVCLQDALAVARYGDEIRVAQGTYQPDRRFVKGRAAQVVASGDRTDTFQLISGVTLAGGYAGFGEPDPNAWDVRLYETILSGDLNGDDGPGLANNSENSYHVVTGSGTDATAVLDGFTITAGNANRSQPYFAGGGVYNDSGSPTVTHCTLTGNFADSGAGMSNDWSSHPNVIHCTFVGNSAGYGGGISSVHKSNPTVTNCAFIGNRASEGGGGMNCGKDARPTVTHCTFSGNSAAVGAGIRCEYSLLTVANTILWGNAPGEIYLRESSIAVGHCNVRGGWPGVGNIDADPLFVDAYGADGVIGTADDDLRLRPTSPCIDAGDNSAIPQSTVTDLDGNPRIINGIVDMGAYEGRVAPAATAYNPSPADGVLHAITWVALGWSPGYYATSHDVYFGDDFDEVYTGTGGTFQGNMVETMLRIGSARSPALVPGTTYYWRVDAVNDLHADSPWRGDVWSFTVASDDSGAHLVAYYPLMRERGITVRDESGNGHDGAAQGPLEWIDGPMGYGQALYFDGGNPARTWLDCGTWDPSAGTGQLTIALWVRWDGPIPDVWQDIIVKRDHWNEQGTEEMWVMGIHANSHAIGFNRSRVFPPCGDRVLPLGQWSHVSVTFDGATMVFYIDAEETGRGRFSFGPKTDSALLIAAGMLSGWGGFHGALDEIRLYNKALSPEDIESLSTHYSAFNPEPPNGASHPNPWVTLAWSPGEYAVSHDVYFGDDFASVNAGTGKTFQGNQIETSLGIGSARSPSLVPGTTYYWRVDEIGADGTTYRGDVWSFTVPLGPPVDGHPIELTEATFDQIVLGSDIPVLVDFWAPWCGPCLIMAPVIEEIAEEYAGRALICKLNTDTSPNINSRYEIRAIPTFILFKDGQIRERWLGTTSKSKLTAAIDALLQTGPRR
jgi:thioredoxin